MERILSLLLGLPTSTSNLSLNKLPHESYGSSSGPDVGRLVVDAIAKILERNQLSSCADGLRLTKEVDRELSEIALCMPANFWRATSFAGMATDSDDAFRETFRTFNLTYYYAILNQLHLPYILTPDNAQRLYSQSACANASREILARHISLRTCQPITTPCRLSDLLALIAGLTLVICHISSHCSTDGGDNLLRHHRLGDIAVLEHAIECMQRWSETNEGIVASQGIPLLQHLLKLEHDAAQGNKYELSFTHHPGKVDPRTVLMVNVNFGTILFIARHSNPQSDNLQDDHSCISISLGGIGSVHLRQSGRSTRRTSVHQDESKADNVHGLSSINPSDGVADFDAYPIYPDAGVDMNDWNHQGFDTAFFEALMHFQPEQTDTWQGN